MHAVQWARRCSRDRRFLVLTDCVLPPGHASHNDGTDAVESVWLLDVMAAQLPRCSHTRTDPEGSISAAVNAVFRNGVRTLPSALQGVRMT